jgi:hypothetical protein
MEIWLESLQIKTETETPEEDTTDNQGESLPENADEIASIVETASMNKSVMRTASLSSPALFAEQTPVVTMADEADESNITPDKRQIDIVFVIEQIDTFSDNKVNEILSSITSVYSYVKRRNLNAEIYISHQNTSGIFLNTLYNGNRNQIANILSASSEQRTSYDYLTTINSIYDLTESTAGDYKETYIFSVIGELESFLSDAYVAVELRKKIDSDDKKTHISIISDNIEPTNFSFAMGLIKNTNGALIDFYGDENSGIISFGEEVIEYIFSNSTFTTDEFTIISSVNLENITLDSPVTYEMYTAHIGKKNNFDIDYSNFSDTDNDSLYDFEEIDFESGLIEFDLYDVILPTIAQCEAHVNKPYVRSGIEKARKFYETLSLNFENIRIIPIVSHPCDKDGDKDGLLDDEYQWFFTNPLCSDTDGDNLSDGQEVENWFDPLDKNPDGDLYNDYYEFYNLTNPYSYDQTGNELTADFLCGVVLGDFYESNTYSALVGQIVGGVLPGYGTFGDVRDIIANVTKEDSLGVILSAVGLFPALGDLGKTAGTIATFFRKNIDDAPLIVKTFLTITKNSPDIFKSLSLSAFDDIVYSLKKGGKITKSDYAELRDIFMKNGKNLDELVYGAKSRDDIIGSAIPGKSTKGGNIILQKLNGDYESALTDFYSLCPMNIKPLGNSRFTGFQGVLPDGYHVTIRSGSTNDGRVTLQFYNKATGRGYEIRYGKQQ